MKPWEFVMFLPMLVIASFLILGAIEAYKEMKEEDRIKKEVQRIRNRRIPRYSITFKNFQSIVPRVPGTDQILWYEITWRGI